MTSSIAVQTEEARQPSLGPWLWGPGVDLSLFLGSAGFALALVALGQVTGWNQQPFPEWGWLLFVLAIDVAHVYATLFRTYLDPVELKRHPVRYSVAPLAVFALGVALHSASSVWFWRVFAYVAVFHFIRQQVGWVAIYRAKSQFKGALDRWLDQAAVYLATLYPIVYWHAHLEGSNFAWFVQGDFLDTGVLAHQLEPVFRWAFWVSLLAFVMRQAALWVVRRTVQLGKVTVVLSTAAIWYVGIVATNSDFAFTVTNVIVHGVPYFALLWAYAKARSEHGGALLLKEIRQKGVFVFVALLVSLAFAEELLWEHLVFHERPWLFGASGFELPASFLSFAVPLLMVPQATHYVLDGVLWRSKDTRALSAQRRALGFR